VINERVPKSRVVRDGGISEFAEANLKFRVLKANLYHMVKDDERNSIPAIRKVKS
jgi:hypothetical protein